MSRTIDQRVTAPVVLLSDQQFTGDIVVRKEMMVESKIVDGVNLLKIDETSLKIFGEQHFYGNVVFEANVTIGFNLNTRWLNQVNTDYFMSKNTKVHTFFEETTFTRDLSVLNSMNIISGKRISGVNLEVMKITAVQRNSSNRVEIRGKKTFGSMIVDTMHAELLNNVAFSKRHLLLKSDQQTITGEISFAGNVVVNTTLVTTINDINIGNFNSLIVKRDADNLIESVVQFDSLKVAEVDARALIDNVNISIFNTISDTLKQLNTIQTFAHTNKRSFESFEKQLFLVSAKFLFYDYHLSVYPDHLRLSSLSVPLLVASIHGYLIVLFDGQVQSDCFEVHAYLKDEKANTPWTKMILYSPFAVISVHKVSDHIMLSSVSNHTNENLTKCLRKNLVSDDLISVLMQNLTGNILFQTHRLLPSRSASTLIGLVFVNSGVPTQRPNIAQVSDNHLAICHESTCSLSCLTCGNKVNIPSLKFDSSIRKVLQFPT